MFHKERLNLADVKQLCFGMLFNGKISKAKQVCVSSCGVM